MLPSAPRNYLEITVSSVAEAMAVLLELRRQTFFSFRGQRDAGWELGPHDIPEDWENRAEELQKATRGEKESVALSSMCDSEKTIYWRSKSVRQYIHKNLSQFIRHTQAITESQLRPKKTEWWDNLIFAHHYGLKTLLLDWTSNPLVALYFAVENVLSAKDDTISGSVIALRVRDQTNENGGKRWFEFSEVVEQFPDGEFCPGWIMINPPFNSDRIIRQSGKFSYHPSIIDRKLVFRENSEIRHRLAPDEAIVKVVIGGDGVNPTADIRKELGIMNIHHGALFPDYDGFARYINDEWRTIATPTSLGTITTPQNLTSPSLDSVRKFMATLPKTDSSGPQNWS